MRRVYWVADGTKKSITGIALVGLHGVQVVAAHASASSIKGVVGESSVGIAVDADWRI